MIVHKRKLYEDTKQEFSEPEPSPLSASRDIFSSSFHDNQADDSPNHSGPRDLNPQQQHYFTGKCRNRDVVDCLFTKARCTTIRSRNFQTRSRHHSVLLVIFSLHRFMIIIRLTTADRVIEDSGLLCSKISALISLGFGTIIRIIWSEGILIHNPE